MDNLWLASDSFNSDSTICATGRGTECAGDPIATATGTFKSEATTLGMQNCGSFMPGQTDTSTSNVIDSPSGLSTSYSDSNAHTMTLGGLLSATQDSTTQVHPFPSLKTVWNELGSTYTVPLTTISNTFEVDVPTYVNSQYPIGDPAEITKEETTEEEVTIIDFRITESAAYGAGILVCILGICFFKSKMKKEKLRDLAYRAELKRRNKEQKEGLRGSINQHP